LDPGLVEVLVQVWVGVKNLFCIVGSGAIARVALSYLFIKRLPELVRPNLVLTLILIIVLRLTLINN
jgi:hypothetical protein